MKLISVFVTILFVLQINTIWSAPLPLYSFYSQGLGIDTLDPTTGKSRNIFSYESDSQYEYISAQLINETNVIASVLTNNGYAYITIDLESSTIDLFPYYLPEFGFPNRPHFNPNNNLIYTLNQTVGTLISIDTIDFEPSGNTIILLPSVITYAMEMGYVDTILDTTENLFYIYINVGPFPQELDFDEYPCSQILGCNYFFVYDLNNNELVNHIDLRFWFKILTFLSVESPTSILAWEVSKNQTVEIIDFNPKSGRVNSIYTTYLPLYIQGTAVDILNNIVYMLDFPGTQYTLGSFNYQTNSIDYTKFSNIAGTVLRVQDV
ncbi:hypothetical protein DLAC_07864 [Tieghemostelium lacteum]|uniref:Uncharacterized protein n=1 Tax=Tieghemostelium lacteum TaxID=361077 RepID=A0A151ZAL5_TIELA|nr:hypothetical protein DLAC_07864 [Tieghemostelium lacteum]|eukprot:KYQ90976.1 hypothetical protein DLAC_07864 [Tieghemostelium lacteum]